MTQPAVQDDEAWKKEFGVPSTSEPFIQKYLNGREALIAQEKRLRSGSLVIMPPSASSRTLTNSIRSCFPGNFVAYGPRGLRHRESYSR